MVEEKKIDIDAWRVKNILFFINQGIGDAVQALPMLKTIRKYFDKAHVIAVISNDSQKRIFDCEKLADEFYYYDAKAKEQLKLLLTLRKKHIDLAITDVISDKKKRVVYLFFCGCKHIVAHTDMKLFRKTDVFVSTKKNKHRVEKNLELVRALGLQPIEKYPTLNFAYKSNTINSSSGRSFIGLCMGSASSMAFKGRKKKFVNCKQWPVQNVVELTQKLDEAEYAIILLGGKTEQNITEEMNKFQFKRVYNFINKVDYTESMRLLNICDLVIGVDTGLMHTAAALGKKTLTLFGPSSPDTAMPYACNAEIITVGIPCQPCFDNTNVLYDCIENKCMKNITTDMVYRKAMEMISDEF